MKIVIAGAGAIGGYIGARLAHAGADVVLFARGAHLRAMQQQGVRPGGSPWESYITDPAEHPDPANWRTDVYWPITT